MRPSPRIASASLAWLAFFSLVVLAGLLFLLYWTEHQHDPTTPSRTGPLIVYCAAGLQEPVSAIAREYQQAYGVPVQVQYGGSQTLLANIEVAHRGDLYIPADDSYIHLARGKDLIDETLPLARMTPVLAVRKGNPKKIQTLEDLKRPDVRLSLANPDATAVGKLVATALEKSGHWKGLRARSVVEKATVNEVANDLKVGAADAGFIWDATLKQYPDLEEVPVPQLKDVTSHVTAAVLRSTTQPTAALHFARFLAARDRGLPHFEKSGFRPVDGDEWSDKPELHVFAGAMLLPAIEDTIKAFEKREGVKVATIYDGCGNLVGQMKTGKRPDMYFACDKSFMSMDLEDPSKRKVSDLFFEAVDVSNNQLVILVPRGNPHHITSLEDLGKPSLRIGIGHEKQCALGALTQKTLTQAKYLDPIMKNVQVQEPTGAALVNQLLTGSLDAVIVYVSNASAAADKVECIPIKDLPCAIAVQPIAVGRNSAHKYLAGRLMDAIRSRQSRERFEKNGFHWQEATK